MDKPLEVDYLVVGAGPAGGAMASFLGQNGLKGMMLSNASGTADTPRAHVTNPPALECLRDIGIEQDAVSLGSPSEHFGAIRWCRSMVGEEFGKLTAWSYATQRLSDLASASPCTYVDLPQSYLEPLLVKFASQHGFEVRFSTQVVRVERLNNGASLCHVRDGVTGYEYKIRSKFLFGADGGRSQVARDLSFQFTKRADGGMAYNIFFKADLKHIITDERHAGLNFIANPESKGLRGTMSTVRMVRPWNQWILASVSFSQESHPFQGYDKDSPALKEALREAIGDDTLDIEILKVDRWSVRDIVAEAYQDADGARAFLLGDAAHRHPPAYGLGSNTCIQDAYNLAWKVAYVAKGWAGHGLLDSYTTERQPIGAMLVKEANHQLRAVADVFHALGTTQHAAETGISEQHHLYEATAEGARRREILHDALEVKRQEAESLGAAMNHFYTSEAIYLKDEEGVRPKAEGDPLVHIQIGTYPGSRLPHAWLDIATRKSSISTQDLAGKGSFCLLTGIGGEAWRQAAREISRKTGIPIRTFGIGFGLDYHDVYRDWKLRRGVEEDGCVLVRPDRFVAWRSPKVVDDCESKLQEVFDSVLDRKSMQE